MYIHNHRAGFGSVAIIGLIGVVLLAGGAIFLSKGGSEHGMRDNQQMVSHETGEMTDFTGGGDENEREFVSHETDMSGDEGGMVEEPVLDSTMTKKPIATNVESGLQLSEVGTFEDYSPEKLALADGGDVALFFYAPWCPTCRGLESDINANIDKIPANTHILKVDYDSETELKKKYGIVRQHTLVQVNSDGTEIKTLTGLVNTLDQVVSQL